MFAKIFLIVVIICSFNIFAIKLHKRKHSNRVLSNDQCDYVNYATCDHPSYIRNRATGYFLGRGDAYNTYGLNVIQEYQNTLDKWCISSCFIANTFNSLVLDIAESDLQKKQVIVWPLHGYDTGNQAWVVKLESTGFSSIRTQTYGTLLALASVDAHDQTKGITLADYDPQDVRQQWTIQE